jgi:hypothetical protein
LKSFHRFLAGDIGTLLTPPLRLLADHANPKYPPFGINIEQTKLRM